MKKGQMLEGVVLRVDFPNKGIVQVGDETVVVKNSLPGQKIRLSVNKVKHGKAEGCLLEVVEKSPLEGNETCSLFGVCGGCTYLSMPYGEQTALKERQVRKLLDGVLMGQNTDYLWEGIHESPVCYGYRNKMEYTFGNEVKDGPLTLGLHKRRSFYDIVQTDDCRIVDEDFRLILKKTKEFFSEKGIRFFHRLTHEGYLRHLLIRKAAKTGEILVALVTTGQMDAEREKDLVEGYLSVLLFLEKNGELTGKFAGILHVLNDSPADVVQSDRTDVLYGRDYFYEELLGLSFKVSAFSFFQTNSRGAEVLYRVVRDYVGDLKGAGRKMPKGEARKKGLTVFDLYSGTGTIAQLMAQKAEKVVGVEIVEEAVDSARENAKQNGLENCTFIAGDVLKVVGELEDKPDLIILDPPRDGIHPRALPKIIGFGVEKIVYVSCKPTSLARDLEVFLENGYIVERACCVDQFPWTANVETVCLLRKYGG